MVDALYDLSYFIGRYLWKFIKESSPALSPLSALVLFYVHGLQFRPLAQYVSIV